MDNIEQAIERMWQDLIFDFNAELNRRTEEIIKKHTKASQAKSFEGRFPVRGYEPAVGSKCYCSGYVDTAKAITIFGGEDKSTLSAQMGFLFQTQAGADKHKELMILWHDMRKRCTVSGKRGDMAFCVVAKINGERGGTYAIPGVLLNSKEEAALFVEHYGEEKLQALATWIYRGVL